jgi:hypothetical protein
MGDRARDRSMGPSGGSSSLHGGRSRAHLASKLRQEDLVPNSAMYLSAALRTELMAIMNDWIRERTCLSLSPPPRSFPLPPRHPLLTLPSSPLFSPPSQRSPCSCQR